MRAVSRITRAVCAALALGACVTANTSQQDLGYERWARCATPYVQLERVDLDARITFLFSNSAAMAALESVIVDFGREVFRDKKVRSDTFARAVALFGREGVVNLAALMGNYAATAIMFGAVDQHLHPDRPPLLPLP